MLMHREPARVHAGMGETFRVELGQIEKSAPLGSDAPWGRFQVGPDGVFHGCNSISRGPLGALHQCFPAEARSRNFEVGPIWGNGSVQGGEAGPGLVCQVCSVRIRGEREHASHPNDSMARACMPCAGAWLRVSCMT